MKKIWLSTGMVLTACAVALVGAACAEAEEKTTTYQVIFMSEETIYDQYDEAQLGDIVVFPEKDPVHSPDDDYQYAFLGWKHAGDSDRDLIEEETATVTGNMTYEAVFSKTPVEEIPEIDRLFTVNFYDMDFEGVAARGDLIKSFTEVQYGSSIEAPEPPVHDGYHFSGWDINSFDNVRGNMFITARYEKNVYTLEKHALGDVAVSDHEFGGALDWSVPSAADILVFKGWFLDENYTIPVEDLNAMPALEALEGEERAKYDIDEAGHLHVYAKHVFDFKDFRIYAEQNMIYGGENNKVHFVGSHALEGLTYSFQWEVDGVAAAETGRDLVLVDAGERAVKLTVTANYKEGFIIQNEVLEETYHVDKATLTATPSLDHESVIYGDKVPEVSVRYEGFFFGDTPEDIGLTVTHTYLSGEEDVTAQKDKLDVGEYTVTTTPAELRNYNVTVADLTFNVQKKTVSTTLTVADHTYGNKQDFVPVITFEGLVYDQQPEVLGTPVLVLDGTDQVVSEGDLIHAGEHTLSIKPLDPANYSVTMPAAATFNVAKRSASATLSAKSGVYGTLPEPSYTLDNVLEADKAHFENPVYSYKTANGREYQNQDNKFVVNSYTVTAAFAESNDYETFTVTPATFEITKKPITIGVKLDDLKYGDARNPQFDYSETDFAYKEDESVFSGVHGFVYADAQGNYYGYSSFPVGDYSVKARDFESPNYEISFPQHEFKVTPAPLTLTLKQDDIIYGFTPRATIEYEGFVNDEGPSSVLNGNPAIRYLKDGAEMTEFHAGTYTATTTASAKNYEIKIVEATFQINPRTLYLGVSLTNGTIKYGTQPKATIVATKDGYNGFLNTEEREAYLAGAKFVYTGTTSYEQTLNAQNGPKAVVGSYTISLKGLVNNPDYTLTTDSATLIVNKATLTVTDTVEGFTYGEQPTHVVKYAGFVYGEKEGQAGVLAGQLTYTYQKDGAETAYNKNAHGYFDAGSYTFTATGLSAANYDIEINGGSFTVAKKALTVTAKIANFTYGDTIAENVVYGEFAEGESKDDLQGFLGYDYTKGGTSYTDYQTKGRFDAGTYQVTPNGLTSNNYNIQFVANTFTVARKSLTVGVNVKKSDIHYGDLTPENLREAFDPTFEGFVEGETADTLLAGQQPTYTLKKDSRIVSQKYPVGTYTVTASDYTLANYEITYAASAEFEVTPKQLTATVTTESITYGTKVAPKVTFEGFAYNEDVGVISGTPQFSYTKGGEPYTAKTYFDAGTYTVSVDGYTGENYEIKYVNDSFTVSIKDFDIEWEPSVGKNVATFQMDFNGTKYLDVFDLHGTLQFTNNAKVKGDYKYNNQKHQFVSGNNVIAYELKDFSITYESEPVTDNFNVVYDKIILTLLDTNFNVKLPTANTKTYDGVGFTNISGVTVDEASYDAEDGTHKTFTPDVKYSLNENGNDWSEDLPDTSNFVNVGTYKVYYQISASNEEDAKYYGTEVGSFTVKIEQAATKIDVENNSVAATYDGTTKFTLGSYSAYLTNAKSVTYSITPKVTFMPFGGDESEYKEKTFTNAGTYKIVLSIDSTDNYTGVSETITVTIAKTDYIVTPDADDYTYNATAQGAGITVSGVEADANFDSNSLTITYTQVEDSTNGYQFTNAGPHTVTYSITGNPNYNDKTGNYTFNIKKANFKVEASNVNATFNGGNHFVELNKENTQVSGLYNDEALMFSYGKVQGTYGDPFTIINVEDQGTVYYKVSAVGGNYNDAKGSYTVTIAKAALTVQKPEKSLTYNGEDQFSSVKITTVTGVEGDKIDPTITYSLSESSATTPEIKNANTYTIYYKVTAKNYNDANGSYTVTIKPKQLTLYDQQAHETYTGGAFVPEKFFTVTGAVEGEESNQGNKVYSYQITKGGVVSTIQNAGDYTITLTAGGNYTFGGEAGDTAQISFKIAKATVNKPEAAEGKTYTYNGEMQTFEFKANTFDGNTMSVTGNVQINANEEGYPVTVSLQDTNNYKWADMNGDTESAPYTDLKFVIKKATLAVNRPTGYNDKYDAQDHFISVGVTSTLYNEDAATVLYSKTVNDEDYSETGFTIKNVTSCTVYYKVSAGNNYTEVTGFYTVTITPVNITVDDNFTDNPLSFTYNGTEHHIGIDQSKVHGVEGDNDFEPTIQYSSEEMSNYSSNVFGIKDYKEGGVTVYYKIDAGDNYNVKTGSYTVTVNKADLTVTANNQTLEYNGEDQFGKVKITVTGVNGEEIGVSQITYRSGEQGEYSATAPQIINANTYTVYYVLVPNNSNYNDAEGSYTITIDPKALTVNKPAGYNGQYDKNDHFAEVTVEGLCGGDSVTVQYRKGDIGDFGAAFAIINVADSCTVFYKVTASDNYTIEGVEDHYTVTIERAKADKPTDRTIGGELPIRPGYTLKDLAKYLDAGYKWAKEEQEVIGIRTQETFEAIYNPDPANYTDSDPFVLTFTTRKMRITVYVDPTSIDPFEADFGKLDATQWTISTDDAKFICHDEFGEEVTAEELAGLTFKVGKLISSEDDFTIGGTFFIEFSLELDENSENTYFELAVPATVRALLKYKSVWVGSGTIGEYSNQTLYTIEDALNQATSSEIVVVEYNTSFATAEAAKIAGYDQLENAYNVRGTLLVPYGKTADGGNFLAVKDGGPYGSATTSSASDRASTNVATKSNALPNHSAGYSSLTIPEGINLDVTGRLIVNAVLTMLDGPSAYIYGANYGELVVEQNAEITIRSNGTLDSMGYTSGKGRIITETEANIYEPMNISGFKGHNPTLAVCNTTFPLNQFTLAHIACEMVLTHGVSYMGRAYIQINISSGFSFIKTVNLLGDDSSYFIQLETDATCKKLINVKTGEVRFTFNGNVIMNNLEILNQSVPVMGAINISTANRQIPIAGHFYFDIQSGILTIPKEVQLKLLPGAQMYVADGATLDVQGGIYAYGQKNVSFSEGYSTFKDGNRAYPSNVKECYKTIPGLLYTNTSAAKITVDGTLKLSKISGIEVSGNAGGKLQITTSTLSGTILEDDTPGSEPITYRVSFKSSGINSDGSFIPLGSGNWEYNGSRWIGENYYQIIYDANGGELTGEESDLYTPAAIGESTITTSDPTRDYYDFTGWYFDQQCTQKVGQFSKCAAVGDVITVFAGWEKVKYDIVFETNANDFTEAEIQLPEVEQWFAGQTVQLPQPTWNSEASSDLVFSGWWIYNDYTGEIQEITDDNIDLLTISGGEIVLYGKFRFMNQITVRFEMSDQYADEITGVPTGAIADKRNNFSSINAIVDEATSAVNSIDDNQHQYYLEGWQVKTKTGDLVLLSDLNDPVIGEDYLDDSEALVLYAKWSQKAKISVVAFKNSGNFLTTVYVELTPDGGEKIRIESRGDTTATILWYRPDTKITYTLYNVGTANSGTRSISGSRDKKDDISKTGYSQDSGTFYMPGSGQTVNINCSVQGSCIVEGTLVTMAGGTQKKVEDLQVGDMVLVFNHETGKYEACVLWSNVHAGNPAEWYSITYLKFSDGTELGIYYEHALFDKTLNRYVYFNATNPTEYIGHKFVKVQNVNGEYVSGEVTLVGFENREEFVRVFSPVSLFHMNVVTNGLLSMTAWPTNSEGFENYFAFDEDMKYDEEAMQADIEKYGLYTYEDFKDLMTEDLFNALPWKYFKIAVGKGMMTWDDILYTIEWIYTTGQIQLD